MYILYVWYKYWSVITVSDLKIAAKCTLISYPKYIGFYS